MNISDLHCWFNEFGVRGLSVIESGRDKLILEFADGTYVEIEEARLGRVDVTVWPDRREWECTRHERIDLRGLIDLLKREGKAVRV